VTHKLLLADDSVTIQRVIELTFSGEDIKIIVVGDGEQAIARIPIDKPDIVLADIGMPKRSGYDVAAFVKQQPGLSHIPVLLLAGAFEPVDEARAKEVKCDGVLVKPFEPQLVIARVRELLERGAAHDAAPTRSDAAQRILPAPVVQARGSFPAPAPTPAALPAPKAEPLMPSPAPVAEPRGATQQPPPAAAGDAPGATLEDYFDRLDAAFATLGNAPSPAEPLALDDDPFGAPDVPTIDDVLAGSSLRPPQAPIQTFGRVAPPPPEPPDASATLSPAPRPRPAAANGDRPAIANVFNMLFAVEQGEADPATIRIGPPAAAAAVTDDLVDEVTRRVLARLAPGSARDVVADIVSEVAERLVREEIERVRNQRG
jgi:CheY-like chemotaxis protein